MGKLIARWIMEWRVPDPTERKGRLAGLSATPLCHLT